MKEKIKKFLIKQIDILSQKFPEVTFKYGFDETGTQHIIDVEPDTQFKNEEYMNAEFDCVDAFIYEFPEDELLFISNNKYIKIVSPVYIKQGAVNVGGELVSRGEIVLANTGLVSTAIDVLKYFSVSNFLDVEVVKSLEKNDNNIIKFETRLASTSEECIPLAA